MDASHGHAPSTDAVSPLRAALALAAAVAAFLRFLARDVLPQAGRPDPRTITPRSVRR